MSGMSECYSHQIAKNVNCSAVALHTIQWPALICAEKVSFESKIIPKCLCSSTFFTGVLLNRITGLSTSPFRLENVTSSSLVSQQGMSRTPHYLMPRVTMAVEVPCAWTVNRLNKVIRAKFHVSDGSLLLGLFGQLKML
eukprot:Seg2844.3 transcript_id=Seg2844.3/GoldUCD/mRNA.D3Y31 product="hypothetical protein" protein_id=Seg2844.3/GoldUCD/D3Y31